MIVNSGRLESKVTIQQFYTTLETAKEFAGVPLTRRRNSYKRPDSWTVQPQTQQ